MYALISQLTLVCNMQLNVLEDLAEAMKALDEKKCICVVFVGCSGPVLCCFAVFLLAKRKSGRVICGFP